MQPAVECGRRPAKAVAGETFEVTATVIIEGHGTLGAGVVLRDPKGQPGPLAPMHRGWRRARTGTARTSPSGMRACGRSTVEAWSDPIGHWHHDAAIKIPAGLDVELMLTEGALLFERAARAIRQPPGAARPAAARAVLTDLAKRLRDRSLPPLGPAGRRRRRPR